MGLNRYKTAWTWLHKLRRAMVRPGRDRLTGRIEVDETFTAGVDEGTRGRHAGRKTLIVIGAQEDGPGIGRIRMRCIPDASAESLVPFIKEEIQPGSTVHTDGWLGYLPVEAAGYDHEVTFLKGKKQTASELMPQVHRVASLLKVPATTCSGYLSQVNIHHWEIREETGSWHSTTGLAAAAFFVRKHDSVFHLRRYPEVTHPCFLKLTHPV